MNRVLRFIKLLTEEGVQSFIINIQEKDADTAYDKVVSNKDQIKGGKLLAQKDEIVVFQDKWNRPVGQLLDVIYDFISNHPTISKPNGPAGCFQVRPGNFVFFGVANA